MNKFFSSKASHKRGVATLVVVVSLMVIGLFIAVGVTSPVAREARLAREIFGSKQSFFVAEAAIEDMSFRIRRAKNYENEEVLEIGDYVATTTVVDDIITGRKEIFSTSTGHTYTRKKKMELAKGDSVSFNYGVQTGNGGFRMENSSLVHGNIYSAGSVVGTQNNYVYGSVTSAGPNGLINGVHATGTARAHSIIDSVVEGDAYYYEDISDTVVWGTAYPFSEDQPIRDLPISDEQLDSWELTAEEGGIIDPETCPYVIDEDTSIGPVKITCGLEIRGGPTVTLSGMVWVEGDISVENNTDVVLDPSIGSASVAMIAHDPSNTETSSRVILRNSITFSGSGSPGSFVTLVSRNDSAENAGTEKAIEFQQTASGDVLVYSNHGEIVISNSSELTQVTGYQILIKNSAELQYEEGLANSNFDTGPGGSWEVFDFKETQ